MAQHPALMRPPTLPCRSASWRRLALPLSGDASWLRSAARALFLCACKRARNPLLRPCLQHVPPPGAPPNAACLMRLAAAALGPARPQAAYARPICSASSAGKRFRRQKHRAVAPSKRSTAPDPLYDSAATLERLYLSAAAEVDAAAPPLAPAPAAAAGTHQRPQADAQQQAEAPGSPSHHRRKQLEVCGHSGAGLHVCVEHTIDEATGAEMPADPAVPLTGPAAWLAQLMDKVPLSKRTRGIIMLNLLVLLVATNWVRTAGCCRGGSWVLDGRSVGSTQRPLCSYARRRQLCSSCAFKPACQRGAVVAVVGFACQQLPPRQLACRLNALHPFHHWFMPVRHSLGA